MHKIAPKNAQRCFTMCKNTQKRANCIKCAKKLRKNAPKMHRGALKCAKIHQNVQITQNAKKIRKNTQKYTK